MNETVLGIRLSGSIMLHVNTIQHCNCSGEMVGDDTSRILTETDRSEGRREPVSG